MSYMPTRRRDLPQKEKKEFGYLKKLRWAVYDDRGPWQPNLDEEYVDEMGLKLSSDDEKLQLEGIELYRKNLSKISLIEHIHFMYVPQFVEFLTRETFPELQFKAAWVLTNISAGPSIDTRFVVDRGAIPIFVQLLGSPNADVQEQAAWALGNIAGNSLKYRDLVLENNALISLVAQLNGNANSSFLRNATWTLSNFFFWKPHPPIEEMRLALSALVPLLYLIDDDGVLAEACRSIVQFSDGTNDEIQCIIDSGVILKLIELLSHRSCHVVAPVLKAIHYIVTGDDLKIQCLLENQVLPALFRLLTHRWPLQKEICWILSNITAGSKEQIQAVIEAQIFGPLIHLLQNAEFDVKKESAWAISNATSGGTHDQIKYIVSQGCIKPLCDLLVCPDPKIVTVCLEGLENILKVGEVEKNFGQSGEMNVFAQMIDDADGLEKIKNLQSHDNNEICEKAVKILEMYWLEEDEEEMTAGDASQTDFQFGGGNPPN